MSVDGTRSHRSFSKVQPVRLAPSRVADGQVATVTYSGKTVEVLVGALGAKRRTARCAANHGCRPPNVEY